MLFAVPRALVVCDDPPAGVPAAIAHGSATAMVQSEACGDNQQPDDEAASDRRGVAGRIAERRRLAIQSERLLIAFENIREGLGVYDETEALVMMNSRYAQMYAVPADLQRPGTRFSTLLDYWEQAGVLTGKDSRDRRDEFARTESGGSFRLYLVDGRVYEVNEQALPGGGWVSTHEDITDRVKAEERILYLARHDSMTGLLNRGSFQEVLEATIRANEDPAQQTAFALLMFDLDRFKTINDMYGHAAGDSVLTEVSRRIRQLLPPDAVVARLGGDEFAIWLPMADPESIRGLAGRVASGVLSPIIYERLQLEIGSSIGIAHFPAHGSEASSLLKCADRALYRAKKLNNGLALEYHPDLDAGEAVKAELIRGLHAAMCNGEIDLHFQPIVAAASGRCHTAEALLRWTHPTIGRVSPELIIDLAEESRLIGLLGDWILRRALETARQWPDDIVVAVNLSASQFRVQGFAEAVLAALDHSGVSPHRLELELTETVLCTDEAVEAIAKLRAAGIRFSLDDFGSGYASMSYLLRFPFDRVKIDRSFVKAVDERPDRRAIVEAVAGLAMKLGMEVVAEGVETESEHAVARSAGCEFLQGYLFGRPMPAAKFAAYLGLRDNQALAG